MAIKRYNEFVNESSMLDKSDQRLYDNAKFDKGDKVNWTEGDYDYYTIDYAFVDNGRVLYNLRNPQGISSGGRVPQDELEHFGDSMASIDVTEHE